jgi:hypothetical protein
VDSLQETAVPGTLRTVRKVLHSETGRGGWGGFTLIQEEKYQKREKPVIREEMIIVIQFIY